MPPPPVPKKKHEHAIVAVTVVSGAGLRDCERFGKMDPYVTVRLDDSSRSTTVVKGGGTDCKFGDELLYHVDERPMSLMVDAFDKESIGKDDHIGSGEVTLDGPNKVKIGAPLGVTVELTAPGDDAGKGGAGQVELQVLFQIDATPLLKCGFLEKKSSTWPSWDRRWFELRGEILVYFHDVSGSRRLAGELSLADCKEVRSSTAPDKRDAEWELVHNSRTYRFASENEEETLEWITACTAAMSGIACEGPPPIDAPSPAHSDAMAEDSDGSPRGKSAPREAAFVRKYLSTMTGKPAKGEDMFEALKSGVVLCELANKCEPDAILKFNENPQNSIVEMENINMFLAALPPKLGVEPDSIFAYGDLWDGITVGTERAKVLQTLVRVSELYPAK